MEDVLVVKAWIGVSTDSAIGAGPNAQIFWERIAASAYKKNTNLGRSVKSFQCLWLTIQRIVNKFCGIYSQVEGLNASGENEEDTEMKALQVHGEKFGKEVSHLQYWRILKNEPKFQSNTNDLRLSESNSTSDSNKTKTPRPIGCKKAERAGVDDFGLDLLKNSNEFWQRQHEELLKEMEAHRTIENFKLLVFKCDSDLLLLKKSSDGIMDVAKRYLEIQQRKILDELEN